MNEPIRMDGNYQTRRGNPVRILAVDLPGDWPVAFYEAGQIWRCNILGLSGPIQNDLDLLPAPRTLEADVWVEWWADGKVLLFYGTHVNSNLTEKPLAIAKVRVTAKEGDGLK